MPESLLPAMLRHIQRAGPMTVAEYMAEALHKRDGGYYASGDPFGAGGDFVTAPEISQMFGELIGLWTISTWIGAGAPELACLVELGPGRGTLMADMLRAIGGVVAPGEVFQIHLVETNPSLRALQAERLAPHQPVGTTISQACPICPGSLSPMNFSTPCRSANYGGPTALGGNVSSSPMRRDASSAGGLIEPCRLLPVCSRPTSRTAPRKGPWRN